MKTVTGKILAGAGLLFVLFLMFRPYVIVPAGHRAVIFNLYRGVLPTQLGEGVHFITPFADRTEFYDARWQTYSISRTSWEGEVKGDDVMRALTSDGQEVSVEQAGATIHGVAMDVTARGALLVRDYAGTTHELTAGEVTVRRSRQ